MRLPIARRRQDHEDPPPFLPKPSYFACPISIDERYRTILPSLCHGVSRIAESPRTPAMCSCVRDGQAHMMLGRAYASISTQRQRETSAYAMLIARCSLKTAFRLIDFADVNPESRGAYPPEIRPPILVGIQRQDKGTNPTHECPLALVSKWRPLEQTASLFFPRKRSPLWRLLVGPMERQGPAGLEQG